MNAAAEKDAAEHKAAARGAKAGKAAKAERAAKAPKSEKAPKVPKSEAPANATANPRFDAGRLSQVLVEPPVTWMPKAVW